MLLEGKKVLILGVANTKSIAYGIACALRQQGARLAFSYVGDAIRKRVEPISEELGGEFIVPLDVADDASLTDAAQMVRDQWDNVDVIIHSVAFAHRDDLHGRFIDTSREGFRLALDISAYSLVTVCKSFEDLLQPGASVVTMSYYGSQKVITNYNVMGVAKAALEASVRYLAVDLGEKGVRINGISAGPIKTLAASGISGFKTILNHIEGHAPLRRNVTIDDIGGSAVYFASDLSKAVSGEIHFVDCGYNIMGI